MIRKATDGFDMIIQTSEGGLIDHNLMTALLDKKGNLVETFDSNQWNPEDVAKRIRELASQ
jgi:cytochrome oxidase Cu insertion factor (SCO1/SenC/PrrC family)